MSQIAMKSTTLPRLVLGVEDHGKLMTMATGISGPMAVVADQLMSELDRARVVAQTKVPDTAVRMGSIVSFTTTDGFDRTYRLVYPGLREGQTIPWTARDGRQLGLTVTRVEQSQ
jgi:regulator of nucleoside diphosphate kinase